MLKIARILCPVDFSDFSERAFDYGQSLASHYEAKLFVQHVVPLLPLDYPYFSFSDAWTQVYNNVNTAAMQRIQGLLKRAEGTGIETEAIVGEGPTVKGILGFAEEKHVDLIVMGSHGRQGFDRLAMGSVTEKVIRKAACPTLVVSKPERSFVAGGQSSDAVKLRKVLFCTDFSESSGKALTYALSLAMEYNAALTILHVTETSVEGSHSSAAELTRQIEETIPAEAHDWCTVTTVVRAGKPYQEIDKMAREGEMELIVMGVQGRSAADLAFFGSTTHRVIQLAPCPVLVCPHRA